jgi:hypothetical protein
VGLIDCHDEFRDGDLQHHVDRRARLGAFWAEALNMTVVEQALI